MKIHPTKTKEISSHYFAIFNWDKHADAKYVLYGDFYEGVLRMFVWGFL